MSAVGEPRQRLAAGWRAARWPGHVLHAAFRIALVLLLIAIIGAAGLAWRLSQGPLDVAWIARRVEANAFSANSPTRLAIGGASIAWNGFQSGADGGLEIRLRQLRLVDAAAAPIARLEEADATISLLRLFELKVVPRRIALTGLRMRAVRAADGAVTFDLGGLDDGAADPQSGVTLADIMAQLRQPAASDRSSGAGLPTLAQLQRATIHDAQVQLDDKASGKTLRAELDDLDLQRQGEGGVRGAASGLVSFGDATASLRLNADLLPGGGTHVEATLAPTQAGPIAQSSDAIAALGAVDAAVQARATLDLSPTLAPTAAELHVASGGGTLSAAGGTVKFEKIMLDATGKWAGQTLRPAEIALQRFQVVLPSGHGAWPTTVAATGSAARAGGKITASLDLSLDHADFADLGTIWPEAWGGNVRPWLVENVTAGTARDGAFTLRLSAPEDHPDQVELLAAGGTMQAEDLTVHWLRPIPPVEHGQAQLKVIGPDVIDIAIPAATQGALSLKDGLLHFTGLSAKDQFMTLTASIQGPVADTLQLLRHPRLKLLDKHPISIKSAAGTVTSKLKIDLPLKKELQAEQVGVAAQGRLAGLKLGGVVAGRDLDRGAIQFDVTQDGLKASGPATVANVTGAVDIEMDFRAGPPTQVLQRAGMTGRATAAQMSAAGIDPGGLITAGDAGLSALYVAQRDGTARVEVKADLAAAGLALGGWHKSPGPAANASATVVLKNDKLASIDQLDAHGPGMEVVGRAEMVGDRPLLLRLDHIVLGPTRAAGEIRFPAQPGEPIRVKLSGPTLDLSSQLSSKPARPAEGEANWVADVHFDRVEFGKGKVIAGVTAHAEDDGRHLRALQATATSPRMQARITPEGKTRRVSVRAADAGAVLSALDVTDTIRGGSLALEAQYDDAIPSSPLSGKLDLSDFEVHDAVAVGKLLQAITIYGIFDAMRGNGVQFTRLILPFRYDRRQLHIGETRAFSSSLGLTATGWMDFSRSIMDVRGTIVPAYALNSALGRIPLVGRLFSPEKGGGLVSVNYAVTGAIADPSVSVNPLSALTPGFLRQLFNIFS